MGRRSFGETSPLHRPRDNGYPLVSTLRESGFLGPFGSYLSFPTTSKLLMIFLMWLGRLEIVPVLAIFTGAFWKE